MLALRIIATVVVACGGFEKFADWGLIGGPDASMFFDLIK